MCVPLNKIAYQKENQKPYPPGKIIYIENLKVRNRQIYYSQYIIEQCGCGIGKCNKNNKIEQKKIKEHIKSIKPEIFSENRLFFAPGK